jgi:hypothetical protein
MPIRRQALDNPRHRQALEAANYPSSGKAVLRNEDKVLADCATRTQAVAHIQKVRMEGTWGP